MANILSFVPRESIDSKISASHEHRLLIFQPRNTYARESKRTLANGMPFPEYLHDVPALLDKYTKQDDLPDALYIKELSDNGF